MIIRRWLNSWKEILRDFFSCLGFIWFFFEIAAFYFPNFIFLKSINIFFLILCASFLYGTIKNFPKYSFIKKIRGKDVCIEIKIGDAFKNIGSLVIPINNEFDVSLNGNVKKAKSIQNEFISVFYNSKEEHLKNDILNKIDLSKIPFIAGTTIELEQKNKIFYLVVNSKKKENNRVESNLDDFMMALNGLWDYLANQAGKEGPVTIPLINTQHGRDSALSRDIVVKQIIETFISSTRYKIICDKLIISIYPDDLKKGDLDFDSLREFLIFQCENYKDIKFDSKPVGKEII